MPCCHAVAMLCLFHSLGVEHQHDGHGGGMTVMVVDVYVCVRSFHKFEAQRKSLFYWYMATRELAVEKPACQA